MKLLLRMSATVLMIVILTLAGGCAAQAEYDRVNEQLGAARRELHKLTESKEGLEAVIIDQQKQIRSLQALGQKRMSRLFHVKHIKLGGHSGAVDIDGQAGDDGIKIYLLPIDRDGSTIKAAGDVNIQLYDLAATPAENLIGEYHWDVDKISKQWSSGFMTYHYSFVCPWKSGPPKHDQITARVVFVDYLTGKRFSTQKLCKVKLPPTTRPAK